MSLVRLFLARLRGLVHRDGVAGEIREEMQFHLQMRVEELEREGLAHDEARRRATRRFGNVALQQDRGYDVRGGDVMETVLQDLRYGVRLLRTQPRFSIVAIATLAVGVGLSTALFSVIHAALLRPLPFPDPHQLVTAQVRMSRPGREPSTTSASLTDARRWRANGSVFSHAATDRGAYELIVEIAEPERVLVHSISEDYLEVFGVTPITGRTFTIDDNRLASPLVVLLGHAYWRTRLNADPGVVGRQIRVAAQPATIVGVLPAGFNPRIAVWQPLRWTPGFEDMRGTGADVVARLRPDVSRERAEAELTTFTSSLEPPADPPREVSILVRSTFERTIAGYGQTVSTLAAAVGAILLIACVNVAGLLVARGTTRQRELAIRAAIGAGRARLTRQLLTESLVLAMAGGGAGILLAWISLDALVAIVPLSLPRSATASLNLEVLAFAAGLAVFTSLVFGLVPALRLSRTTMSHALAGADRRAGAGLARRSGQVLIGVQVALAVVLLAGAGLMIRSFSRLVAVDLGFDPQSFLTLEVLPLDPSPAVAAEYFPALVGAIRALPEVSAAGASNQMPIGGSRRAGFVRLPGQEPIRVDQRHVLPGYFEVLGLPAKLGRLPTDADRAPGRSVVVINELVAKQIFPGGSPVGQLLPLEDRSPEVIGVVSNMLQDGARSPARANVYWLYDSSAEPLRTAPLAVFVRPREGAQNLAERLRATAHAIGPRVLVYRIRSGEDFLSENVVIPRRQMLLLTLLGGVGLVLTLVGVFSLTSYAVARRTREIGVRMAFGAREGDVVRAMVGDAAWPIGLGLLAGIGGAVLATRLIATLLFQTTPHDPIALAAAAATLAIAALAAAWWPARRAALVDPVTALRAD